MGGLLSIDLHAFQKEKGLILSSLFVGVRIVFDAGNYKINPEGFYQ